VLDSGLGTGCWSARWLPGTRLVRAFQFRLRPDARKRGPSGATAVGVPLAGDDAQAMEVVAGLVREAGFDPVLVGEYRARVRCRNPRLQHQYVRSGSAPGARLATDGNRLVVSKGP
jgi:hypothetical protein